MQTFLPLEEYGDSARVLDKKRLNKQRVECFQILRAITDPEYGWQHHPAVNQWRGYLNALVYYSMRICDECDIRGLADNKDLNSRIDAFLEPSEGLSLPPWTGDERVYASHRSNLMRKEPAHYGIFGWTEPDDLDYFWPSKSLDYPEFNV